ncbi:MAG: hypothetical protein RL265_1731 [Bacteroidota bacterium]
MHRSVFFLSVFFSFLTISSVYAQTNGDETINFKDINGKKQGKWVYLGKDRPKEGFPANGKIEEGVYKNNRKEGVWIKYYQDGVTPKLKGEYSNNRPQGTYYKYFPNGRVMEQGNFSGNLYRDSLKRFHENGKIEYEANLNDQGKEQGSVKYFYPNGQLEFEYIAAAGVPKGKAVRYLENGTIKEILFYGENGEVAKFEEKVAVKQIEQATIPEVKGESAPKITSPRTNGIKFQPNGYNKVYSLNNEIWQDGNFKNGILWDGKVYEYDKDGILLKVKVFKNGIYHSDGQL